MASIPTSKKVTKVVLWFCYWTVVIQQLRYHTSRLPIIPNNAGGDASRGIWSGRVILQSQDAGKTQPGFLWGYSITERCSKTGSGEKRDSVPHFYWLEVPRGHSKGRVRSKCPQAMETNGDSAIENCWPLGDALILLVSCTGGWGR